MTINITDKKTQSMLKEFNDLFTNDLDYTALVIIKIGIQTIENQTIQSIKVLGKDNLDFYNRLVDAVQEIKKELFGEKKD